MQRKHEMLNQVVVYYQISKKGKQVSIWYIIHKLITLFVVSVSNQK